ncbi:hypothetical protein DNK55_25770 [Streptomyces sp. AC1-42T]|nr:hypothetical protein DNK55_25770 [Streptomyces sp. AC1-42T]
MISRHKTETLRDHELSERRWGVGSIGNVNVDAGFGCVRDSEMTYPKGTPFRPGGPKKVERIPHEHSPYWSATGAPQ